MQHYSYPTANSARIVRNEAASNFSLRKMQFSVTAVGECCHISANAIRCSRQSSLVIMVINHCAVECRVLTAPVCRLR